MCINGNFDFYLTDIQVTLYHHSVGNICKWTMLNFFPFVSPLSFVVKAVASTTDCCFAFCTRSSSKTKSVIRERESHRRRVRSATSNVDQNVQTRQFSKPWYSSYTAFLTLIVFGIKREPVIGYSLKYFQRHILVYFCRCYTIVFVSTLPAYFFLFQTNSKPKPSTAQLAVCHPSVFIDLVQHSAFWLWASLWYFFPDVNCQDSYSYYVTFVWSCSVALWDISLYKVEWRTPVVNWPSDRHTPDTRSWLIRSHCFSSPMIQPWCYI